MQTSDRPTFAKDFMSYLVLLRHRAWIIIIVFILFGLIAYIYSKNSTPVYQASTTVLINEAPATKITDYSALVTSERLAQTYAQLMSKRPVLEGVINQLNLNITTEQLNRQIQIQPVRDTTIIEVLVEDTNPEQAAAITNTLVNEFAMQNQALQASRYASSKSSLESQLNQLQVQIEKNNQALMDLGSGADIQNERDRLEANQAQYSQTYAYLLQSYEQVRLTEAQSTSNIVQVESASIPERPIRPRIFTNTILAALVGLMLAVGGVFLFESLDDTLRNPDEIASQLGLPVLGVITKYDIEEGVPVTANQPRTPVSEAFRSLRTNIQFASVDKPLRTLLVTSPSPAEGKSTIAVNLGVVMAQSGRKVLVLDADLRRPRVHKVLGIANKVGISDLFVQEIMSLNGTVQQTRTEDLLAITTGELPPNPSELLGSEKMLEILRTVQESVDLVIIDTPPVMAVTDSAVLSPRVDGVLIVVKPGVTQMAVAQQTVDLLLRGGARLLGVVLNEVNLQGSRYYYYKGYYSASRSYYQEEVKSKRRWNPFRRRRS